jgi:SAM-dependent methyltransferase
MDSERWNDRYIRRGWKPEREPNPSLVREFESRAPGGRLLDLACGEGRNAVWLASRGWRVTGVDFSGVALGRARKLAARRGVHVDWVRADVTCFAPRPGSFQEVTLLYLQLPAADQRRALERAVAAMARGGELFMVGHALRNLTEGAGGPRDPAVLWTEEAVRRQLTALGLAVDYAETLRRPFEEPEGEVRDAFDLLLRAHRQRAEPRHTPKPRGRRTKQSG